MDEGLEGSWYCEAAVAAVGFLAAVFGFLTSRLPRFCPLAILYFLRLILCRPPCLAVHGYADQGVQADTQSMGIRTSSLTRNGHFVVRIQAVVRTLMVRS